jgi:hypothetical protein
MCRVAHRDCFQSIAVSGFAGEEFVEIQSS